jgi:ParB/RepB/Spo0J family partition protein
MTAPKTLFSRPEEISLPAADFHRYPANRVPTPEAIAAMRASILENGQLQPVTARPIQQEDGSEKFEIIFGETRVLGCQAISPSHPVRCYLIPMTDQEAAKIHAIENFQRKDLDPIEEAEAMENMRVNGWQVNAIAETLGITRKTVAQRLRLLKLDETTRGAVRAKTITMNVADAIAQLPENERKRAVEICTNPTHSAEPLPEREALRQIESKIVTPRKRADEWEAKRKALEKKHPRSTFLAYEDAVKAGGWDSPYEPIDHTPGWKLQSEAVRHGTLENRSWGELAEKWGAETFISLPVQGDDGDCSILVKTDPLIDAELAACESDPMTCIFQHPAQKKQAELDREREKAAEEARAAALREEYREALLVITRPEAIQPAAAERLVIEFFRLHQHMFAFTGGLLPGFDVIEDNEAHVPVATAYLKTKSIRGFEALGRLIIAAELDANPNRRSTDVFAECLIGTKALREKDFPLLTEAWKNLCATRLKSAEEMIGEA